MLLEDPVRAALTSVHAGLARSVPGAWRYPPDVSPFVAFDDDWGALAAVVDPGDVVVVLRAPALPPLPPGWTSIGTGVVHQLAFTGALPDLVPALPARRLGDEDVPAMLALVARSRPGPFLARTHALGRFWGAFDGDALVAMAGERMRTPGRIEVSAVTTAPAWRGRGLAAALTALVVEGVLADGEVPFLHVTEGNPARRVYEAMGFSSLGDLRFTELARDGAGAPG